jgi:xanthine dehydrogenase YagT iron-sulfur-binding subunit
MLDSKTTSHALIPRAQSTPTAVRPSPIAEQRTGPSLTVNGMDVLLPDDPRVSLLDFLRERLQLTGTKKGCDQGACGACTVLADGQRILSCLALAVQYQGRCITTIEGLETDGEPHPLQHAFIEHDGFQCGYCTPGQICSALGMLAECRAGMPSAVTEADEVAAGPPTEAEIRERMSGNLCRCGAYNGIVAAIRDLAGTDA